MDFRTQTIRWNRKFCPGTSDPNMIILGGTGRLLVNGHMYRLRSTGWTLELTRKIPKQNESTR